MPMSADPGVTIYCLACDTGGVMTRRIISGTFSIFTKREFKIYTRNGLINQIYVRSFQWVMELRNLIPYKPNLLTK